MSVYRLVVFDWEGTISDPLGQLVNAIAAQAEQSSRGPIDLALARQAIISGPVVAMKKLFPHMPPHEQSDLLLAAQTAIVSNPVQICLTPGAREVIESIHQSGISLAIATNKGHLSLVRELDASGLSPFIKVTRSAGQVPAKPCPQMLEEIMMECGVPPEQTVMIGDSISDIEMANQLNVAAVGVDFYFQNREMLLAAGALEVFFDFKTLADYLAL